MTVGRQSHDVIAAVDLGSNSFRLQIGRVVDGQIYPQDSLKESVRLGAGLTPQKFLDEASQDRALVALRRFGERLRSFDKADVRAVGTNALRVAKNAPFFLLKAEEALGFPIEIIGGREEARLIYVGVAHSLPDPDRQQLVVDIGGGSTEFIIGKNMEPLALESLFMGCVSFTNAYFALGVDKRGFAEAELAARKEILSIALRYKEVGWEAAVGSSGTAKALADVLELNGLSAGGITLDGLERLKAMLIKAGDASRLHLAGMRPDRVPVMPGGLAIMLGVFRELGVDHMQFSEGALRLGVLYDLVGRYHHKDMRDSTVRQFMRRYQVDTSQARRVAETAAFLLAQILPQEVDPESMDLRFLHWAASLHEIGISVAHSGFHKHSAYILANADMPGFSKMDQGRLARLVLAHRGKLERVQTLSPDSRDWCLILCLRLSAIIHRARDDSDRPPVKLRKTGSGFTLQAAKPWISASPLTASALDEEIRQWSSVGIDFRVRAVATTEGLSDAPVQGNSLSRLLGLV